jgi:diguanylate cyclase (GGDEF)-like protein
LRHGGKAYRLGGDEFALLRPDRDGDASGVIERRVMDRLGGASSDHGTIGLSAGIATYPGNKVAHHELAAVADEALWAAKSQGENPIVVLSSWCGEGHAEGRQPVLEGFPTGRRRRRRPKAA